jgi:hypothetical protein
LKLYFLLTSPSPPLSFLSPPSTNLCLFLSLLFSSPHLPPLLLWSWPSFSPFFFLLPHLLSLFLPLSSSSSSSSSFLSPSDDCSLDSSFLKEFRVHGSAKKEQHLRKRGKENEIETGGGRRGRGGEGENGVQKGNEFSLLSYIQKAFYSKCLHYVLLLFFSLPHPPLLLLLLLLLLFV